MASSYSSSQPVVRSQITTAHFSIFHDEEKKNELSVCKIESLETLDAEGRPIPGGLYDPRMGPVEQRAFCQTCHMNYVQCPGHPGHIELDVPVYYPLYFNELVRLLRGKCVYCHKFRMATQRVRHYLIRLKLMEMGDVEEAEALFDMISAPQITSDETKNEDKKGHERDVEDKLRQYEARYERFQKIQRRKDEKSSSDLYIKTLQRELIEQFQKLAIATKRCENCGAFSPAFRKDGAAKIFQKPTSKKNRKSMASLKLKYKTGLQSMNKNQDDNSDSEEDLDQDEDNTDSENSDDSSEKSDGNKEENKEADKYLAPVEVEAQVKLFWQQTPEMLNFIWTRAFGEGAKVNLKTADGWKIFFMRIVLVTPNRFRPSAKIGEAVSEHPQNIHLKRIIQHNSEIRIQQLKPDEHSEDRSAQLSELVSLWIDLQNSVNCYMDSSKDPNPLGTQGAPIGIRQILERKEGLFRRHMMGKRVNYCCRSVISPDPYLGTNEIGIPVHFAKTLHYPTPVNDWNVKYLRTLVERGPDQYPGANQIETPDGKIIKLEKLSAMERAGKAKLLLSTPGTKVYRHLIDGDALLVNRQPTLHKPGIMAHRARVLKHVKEQTLRMNYANCNTYNADFDGDEMNCHFVQSELARAEAYFICNTDNQYIVPTSGNPLRGLIQDHVASAVKLTCKDTFLTKADFQQLLYIAVTGLPGTEIVTSMEDMVIPPPAVWKPRKLWTGKQVVSALIAHLCRPPLPQLNLDSKARTPPTALGAEHGEHEVIIRGGELLSGVLDKNAIGNVSLGLVHSVYELYGAELAGRLLNAIGRLMTYYLQDAGHSCGIEDLVLTTKAEEERDRLLRKVTADAEKGLNSFLNENEHADHVQTTNKQPNEQKLAAFFAADRKNAKVKLDGAMQRVINQSASDVIKACLPNGLSAGFLRNNFSMMVLTGAKGSAVNQSQISCFLGQQALEGQRVPMMASGKTLPSFMAFDGSARAGGFVRDRFLTGVKPQEYYFHCMAGREGLVDTAVKTSRSGYLQRCLVKHLEELKVCYDMTVRDSGSNVVQFLYGEDGLDPMSAGLLGGKPNQMLFLARNNQALTYKYSLHADFFNQGIEMDTAKNYHQLVQTAKKMMKDGKLSSVTKGSVLMARKRLRSELPWGKNNISKSWYPVEVLKVRERENTAFPILDIRYTDGTVEKKVPAAMTVPSRPASEGAPAAERAPLFLVKVGLPDTPMNALKLGSSVGACSEKIQDAITAYVANNPDKVITEAGSDSTVTAEALELLIWVKYMRSMACPGEAVGCVAAQSVGEPSTQMTLNTFHLAGHGGANVTLGIPRLREIIMTASKSLKTPTMTIPLLKDRTFEAAKSLARKLSRLSLGELLDHRGGVEVGEQICRESVVSRWERKYRIRLRFQPKKKIEETFGVLFDTIVATVKNSFTSKLDSLIKLDQRRAGESTSGKNDPLKQFRSMGGDDVGNNRRGRGEGGDDDDDEADNGREQEHSHEVNNKNKSKKQYDSEEDEEEDDEDANEGGDDIGNLKLQGSGKEMIGYEDDEESIFGADSDDENGSKKDTSGDDSSDEENRKTTATSASTPKNTKATDDAKSRSSSNRSFEKDKFHFNEKESWVEMEISFPLFSRRLLMAQIAEKAAAATMVRATKDISNAYAVSDTPVSVVTEGVNFEAVWALPDTLIDYNNIKCNDIWRVLQTYGVEAARQSIVSEIQGVFGVYGIDVNPRHLSLIADFMTRGGSYTPMNRIGMLSCPSPFLQMSFETTCSFLTRAAQEGLTDNHNSPSSSIVLGSVAKVGTGCFDLMLPLTATV